jgi:hypothetical protein
MHDLDAGDAGALGVGRGGVGEIEQPSLGGVERTDQNGIETESDGEEAKNCSQVRNL